MRGSGPALARGRASRGLRRFTDVRWRRRVAPGAYGRHAPLRSDRCRRSRSGWPLAASLVLRLGYRQTSVLAADRRRARSRRRTIASRGLTILALSSASDRRSGLRERLRVAVAAPVRSSRRLRCSVTRQRGSAAALAPLAAGRRRSEEPALAVAMRARCRLRAPRRPIAGGCGSCRSSTRSPKSIGALAGARGRPDRRARNGCLPALGRGRRVDPAAATGSPASTRSRPRSAPPTSRPCSSASRGSAERGDRDAIPSVIDDLAADRPRSSSEPLPVRSSISVPMLVKDELIGTLSIAAGGPVPLRARRTSTCSGSSPARSASRSRTPGCTTSCAAGKREWEQTFDAISDPIAVFDSRGRLLRGNSALGDAPRACRSRSSPRSTCHSVGFCGGDVPALRGWRGRDARRVPGASRSRSRTGRIFSVTTFPVVGEGDGPSVVQVAKNVTEEIRSARRLRQMSDELGSRQRPADRDGRAAEVDAGAAAPVREAVGDRPARGRRRARVEQPADERHRLRAAARRGAARRARPIELRRPPELAQDLRRIVDESERAARIVRNLLAFARRQTAARAPQDIAELVTRVLSLRAYDLRLNAIELQTDVRAGAAAGRRRRRPDSAGAAQPDSERRAGDARRVRRAV